VVIAGTVLSIAAALGPVWMVRVGVVVACAAAVTATVLAWREVRADRHQHATAMLATNRAHGATLRMERAQNFAVLQVVTDRNIAAMAEITRQQTVIAQLRGEVSSLKGDRAALTAEVARRQQLITSLEESVRVREAELRALLDADGDDAEVHDMPRRSKLDPEAVTQAAADPEDIWTDGTHPTVVDMAAIDADLIGEPVLPNYEEDRRLA
jgi:hypothetical protein